MNVLIIGDQGFVGTETKKLFQERGLSVFGYDLLTGQDVRDSVQLEEVIKNYRIERILNLAAVARFSEAQRDPILTNEVNASGCRVVSMLGAKYHIPVIYSSTGSVYMPISKEMPITEEFPTEGNSAYAVYKLLGEEHIKHYRNPWIILRYSHLYGANKRFHGIVGGFVDRIIAGEKPFIFGGKQTNDLCYIKDIAEANYLAVTARYDQYYQIYNIGTGEELSVKQVAKAIIKELKYKDKIEYKPQREVDPQRFVYSIKKAKMMLGFQPKWTFEKGLHDLLKSRGLIK